MACRVEILSLGMQLYHRCLYTLLSFKDV